MIAFIKERGEALRQDYAVWQAGMKPGHAIFDIKTFAALYLADARDRKDAFYKPLPMLVRAANAERRTVVGTSSNATRALIVDTSALLLAMRCGLVSELEQAYEIQIPEALPFALLAIEDEWPVFSDEFVQTAKAWLSNSETAVRMATTLPTEALPIGTEQQPLELIAERVAAACECAVAAGELSQSTAATFVADVAGDLSVYTPPVTALVLQPWSLVQLSQAGLLEPIARSVPTYLSVNDRKALAANLSMAERQNGTRRRITALRELVAERLASSAWTTIPRRTSDPGRKRSKLAPHLGSLLEIMDAVSAGAGAKIWVEDRALSRTRLPALVNISDIADDLVERGIVDATRRSAIDQMLRRMGYSFMTVPVAAIVGDVQRAPIVDGAVVETPELANWRSWYGQEVERLAFANQAPEPDETGRITGEPRHLLDMMATARDVLAHIWSNETSDQADKFARSDWVWTCLRFETSPALEWSTKSDEAQRLLMATVLFHTADLPLVAALSSEGLPQAVHQTYIDWFVQNVLDHRCRIDPALGNAFARQIASLLVSQLDRDTEDTGTSGHLVQDYMKQVAGRYLDLFPEQWRDRILSYCDLANKVGTTSVMTLDIGDVAFPAEVVEAAVAEAADKVRGDAPVTVSLTPRDGVDATLTLRQEATGDLAADIRAGSQTVHLDPFLVAVTLRDEASRLNALDAIPSALDLPCEQLATTLHEIATLPTLTERVARQKEAFDLEFVRRLDRVHDQLKHRQSIELSDLSLPAPESIAQYLRLRDPYRTEPGSWLDDMTAALSTDHGLEKAARRIGAVPFNLPDLFFTCLADTKIDFDRLSSAAHARLYLKALGNSTVDDESREKLLGVFIDRLEAQAGLMAALVWKGARQLGRSEAWRRLHPEIAFSLLWVWADRLASSIGAAGVDVEKTAEIIRRSEPADLTYLFCKDDTPVWYHRYAFDIDEGRVMAALVADVLTPLDFKILTPELRSRLLSKIGHEVNQGWYPKLDLAFPTSVDPALWITKDAVAAVVACEAATVVKPFTERDSDAYVQALVAETISPQNPFFVPGLLAGTDLSTISPDTAGALITYLDKLFVDFADADDSREFRHAQGIRAACLGRLNDTAEMEATLSRMASIFQSKHGHQKTGYVIDPSRSEVHRDLAQLIEVVIAYTRHLESPPSAKVTTMAETIARIPETWPGARQGLIEFLDRTITMLEANLAAAIWPSLLRLRQVA